eukprot:m.50228 g.50228  ORF g.50228 m.50228 type:complete len:412 (-) comp15367_c0_seq2:149-1384(-)
MSTSDSVALNTGDVGEEAGAENQVLAQETDTIDDRTCAEKKDEETSYQVPSNLNLTEHYNAVMSHHAKLQSLAGKDPKFKETLELGIKHCDDAIRMVDELRVFSDNEHFSEHSTTSLRYLTVFGYRADFEAMKYPEVDDPDRDEKRLGHLSSTLTLFKDFLERCATLGLCSRKKLQPYLELRPNTRPSRDVKVEQMKEQMRLEAALRTLDEQVRAMSLRGNTAGADDGDDVTREHTIKRLEVWVSKACGQLMTLTAERDMLAMMRGAHRDTAARPVADARSGIRGAPGGEQSDRRRPPRDPSNPPPKPFVITKDMVKEMQRTGQNINRADFTLINRGYGPIGAPTMSLEEYADKEIAEAMQRSAAQAQNDAKQDSDSDNDDVADAATYRARAMDEEMDNIRRGDGNRYNMG